MGRSFTWIAMPAAVAGAAAVVLSADLRLSANDAVIRPTLSTAMAQDLPDWQVPTPWMKKRSERLNREAAEQANQQGLVYKNRMFWQQFQNPLLMEGVFLGNWTRQGNNFSVYLVTHLGKYSKECKAHMPDAVERITTHRTYKTGIGGRRLVSEETGSIFLERRFLDIFDKHEALASVGLATAVIKEFMDLERKTGRPDIVPLSESQAVELAMNAVADISVFHGIAKCGSATMKQFHENYFRLASGMPSLKAAGVSIDGAASESDKIE